ncbi:amidohydrolase [Bacillus aerolatus]|uniref:Amidohydrolase n=1 Tax=Bacillus aerolatus TaxID=2653354 RepID=A0A6I1FFC6_9BACI|nr:M20 family metallopeptidase [Bacillus aerolatus]KAB7706717.1 amidohydrolase [Bacillus aerolatus]
MNKEAIDLSKLTEVIQDEVVEWRRYLHRHPELSFQEEKTAQFVYDTLQSFGHLELTRPTKTSVMARLIGRGPGRVLAIRADMDALPIQEENDFEFVSQNPGVMHACGHDGHTAMLLGTAKVLTQLKDQIQGEVRFLFQHAEELYPGGAEEMVQAGVLDGVDQVIGTHLWSPLEVGKIGIISGPAMASSAEFWIEIHGKGGHAAAPHEAIDSIAIASQVVTSLQNIVSRHTDPLDTLVLSVTRFVGGSANNIIPDSVELSGTVRCFDPQLQDQVPVMIENIIKGITGAYGATYNFEFKKVYRAVNNDQEVTRYVEETVQDIFGEEAVNRMRPVMGGEDFSAYQQKVPGSFIFIGARNEEKGIVHPHHHPRFTIDESALPIGVRLLTEFAYKMLK